MVDIYDNKEIALKELREVYPGINFDHFRERTTLKDKLRLYFVAAEVI
jgi:hypothetical protein